MQPALTEAIHAGHFFTLPHVNSVRWLLVLVAAGFLVLTGCGGDSAPPEATPPPQVSAGGAGGAGDTGEPAEPLTPSETAMALLEAATYEIAERAQYSYTIVVHVGGEEFASTAFTIDPEERPLAGLPPTNTPLHGFEYQSDLGSSSFDWSMRYVVPAAEFPADAFAAVRPGERPGWLDQAVLALLRPAEAYAQEGGGHEVVVRGVLKEVRNEVLTHVIGEEMTTLADAVSNVADSLDASEWYRRQLRELEELRRCAENPTNPLTRRMYEGDPSSKDRIMRDVRQTELEIKSNTMVRFIGMLNSQGAGLVKWLGFVVGPVTGWADQQLVRLTEQRLRDLRNSITPCDDKDEPHEDGRWTGTITYRFSDRRVVNQETATSWSRVTAERSGEVRWELEEGAAVTVEVSGVATVQAPYTFSATHRSSVDRGNLGTFSCPGDQRGGMHTATHTTTRSENGEINAEGDGEVSIVIRDHGVFVIEARATHHSGMIDWSEQTRASGGACYQGPPDRSETGTMNFNPQLALPYLVGDVGPDPNVLSGTSEEVVDSGLGHVVRHEYEWDLRRT